MEPLIARLNRIETRRIRKQAVWWVTELHSPGCDPVLEEQVRQWIAKDPRHAVAFELAYWSGVGGAERFDAILEMARESLIAGGENGDLPRLPGSDWGVRRR